jgi:hypothetical protein
MVGKAELLAWVNSLSDDSCIGVDEGGLTLREVLPDDTLGEAYIELGGIPEGVEVECLPGPYRLLAAEVPYLPGTDPTSKYLEE